MDNGKMSKDEFIATLLQHDRFSKFRDIFKSKLPRIHAFSIDHIGIRLDYDLAPPSRNLRDLSYITVTPGKVNLRYLGI